jgi:hypothetical protein
MYTANRYEIAVAPSRSDGARSQRKAPRASQSLARQSSRNLDRKWPVLAGFAAAIAKL